MSIHVYLQARPFCSIPKFSETETPFTKSENREDERKQRNSSKYKEREEFAFASLSSKEIN
jgi:hypothetical protein